MSEDVGDEDGTERLKGSIGVWGSGKLQTNAVPVVGDVEDEDDAQCLEGQKNGGRRGQTIHPSLVRSELPDLFQHVVKLHGAASRFCV